MWRARHFVIGFSVIALLGSAAAAEQSAAVDSLDLDTLAELPIQDLMNLQVTSVAGVEKGWFRTPAAMYVITGEDIRRSGYRSIAEALRLAPGVFVGRTDSNSWSVGTRGFNGGLGNKTLILIDGRAVYDPLFSGTFWDVQDTLLEDIDRIEVIRGPGATLWGANAVNGVINVVTKRAQNTQGLYASGGGGTEERAFGEARYGAALGDAGWLRLWGKYFDRDSTETPAHTSAGDDWNLAHGGFRLDLAARGDLQLTLQGDLYHSGRIGEGAVNGRASGGNLLFRASRQSGAGAGWTLQAYYDRTERLAAAAQLDVNRNTFDVDFRHHFAFRDIHELIWGLSFRNTSDNSRGSGPLTLDPMSRRDDTYAGFLQDTITIVPNRVFAMVGSKFERNDYTRFEVQPSGRLWWTPDERQMLWASISRAVRVPSRLEADVILSSPVIVRGDHDMNSEVLIAYEMGYRREIGKSLSGDLTAFYNHYDELLFVPLAPPFVIGNGGSAEGYGGELALTWQPDRRWRLIASYSFLDLDMHGNVSHADEGSTPHHMAKLRSEIDVLRDLELNGAISYASRLSAKDVPAYWRLDLGMTWRATDDLELSLWGQNLLEDTHAEFSSTRIERGVYASASLRF